jgi:hypothetical protein
MLAQIVRSNRTPKSIRIRWQKGDLLERIVPTHHMTRKRSMRQPQTIAGCGSDVGAPDGRGYLETPLNVGAAPPPLRDYSGACVSGAKTQPVRFRQLGSTGVISKCAPAKLNLRGARIPPGKGRAALQRRSTGERLSVNMHM